MGAGENHMTALQLEDVIFNCLDFSMLYQKLPHFYLAGRDAVHHPALRTVLDILHAEGATFSILSEPEASLFRRTCAYSPAAHLAIGADGEARSGEHPLGNVLEDRLADLWAVSRMREGETP